MVERVAKRFSIAIIIFMALSVNLKGIVPDFSYAAAAQRVLILHSYHDGFTWTDSLSDGIRSAFSEKASETELKFEYLDTRFLASHDYLHEIRETLSLKYTNQKIDLIIACDDHALNFLYDYASSIFPRVPVVFCSVSGYRPEMDHGLQLTGLRDSIDIAGTIKLALKLHPKTEEIAGHIGKK